jgi:O-antigen ligase
MASMVVSHSVAAIALGFLWLLFIFNGFNNKTRFMPDATGIMLISLALWSLLTTWFYDLSGDIGKYYYYTPVILVPLMSLSRGHLSRLFTIAVVLCSSVIMIAFIQKSHGFSIPGPFQPYQGRRVFGYGNPIQISALYAVLAITSVSLIFFGKASKKLKTLLTLCILSLALGILLTQSRGFYVAIVITITIMLVHSRDKKLFLAAITAGITVVLYVLSDKELINRVMTIFDTGFPSNMKRIAMWKVALNVIKESWTNFLFGIGYGNWKIQSMTYFDMYYPSFSLKKAAAEHTHVHNIYLQTMLETGIVGLFLYASFIFSIIKRLTAKLSSLSKGGFEYAYTYGIFMSVVCYLIGGLFDYMHAPNILLPFYVLVSTALMQNTQGKEERLTAGDMQHR